MRGKSWSTASEPTIYDPATSSRPLPRVRGRRSRASSSQEPVDPVCAWNHGPVFTSKPLNSTREPSGAHARAHTPRVIPRT